MTRRSVPLLAVLLLLAVPALATAAMPLDRYRWPVASYVQARPTLLARYSFHPATGSPRYDLVRHEPRAFRDGWSYQDASLPRTTVLDAGAYDGWDVLPTLNHSVSRFSSAPGWTRIVLNRTATVAVVWRGGTPVPDWLGPWVEDGTVRARWRFASGTVVTADHPVFVATLPAGTHDLGGVNNPGDATVRSTYWLLFAEEGGTPSVAPPLPPGDVPTPQPNQPCPAWVHDLHATEGPDGETYATWHPQIDPVFWCYYGHEHGSDPDAFLPGREPSYGYVAGRHGMTEGHAGFKTFAFADAAGRRYLVTMHVGTGSAARACVRFHTLELAVVAPDGNLLADVRLMADFGRSLNSANNAIVYAPTACPDQGAVNLAPGSRKIPLPGDVGYEPWVANVGPTLFFAGTVSINTPDSATACADATCDAVVPIGTNSGTLRLLTLDTNLHLADPGASPDGRFCTDAPAVAVVACDAAGAVAQFVAPGLALGPTDLPVGGQGRSLYDVACWGQPLVLTTGGSVCEREDSIPTGGPN